MLLSLAGPSGQARDLKAKRLAGPAAKALVHGPFECIIVFLSDEIHFSFLDLHSRNVVESFSAQQLRLDLLVPTSVLLSLAGPSGQARDLKAQRLAGPAANALVLGPVGCILLFSSPGRGYSLFLDIE